MEIRRPRRATRTYTQHLAAAAAEVLPLLCPVREAEWLERWDPTLVLSDSGVAEPGCVFVTPGGGEAPDATWIVTRHEPDSGHVEMVKVVPGVTVTRLSIVVRDVPGSAPSDYASEADVTYELTSLGSAGDAAVDAFTDQHYAEFMHDWEHRLNHFLTTGEMLRGAE